MLVYSNTIPHAVLSNSLWTLDALSDLLFYRQNVEWLAAEKGSTPFIPFFLNRGSQKNDKVIHMVVPSQRQRQEEFSFFTTVIRGVNV